MLRGLQGGHTVGLEPKPERLAAVNPRNKDANFDFIKLHLISKIRFST